MTIGDPGAQEAETGQDVSGVVTGVLVRHVRAVAGDEGVARMLDLAGDDRPVSTLETPTAWTSHDRTVALFDAAAAITFDPEVGRRVGQEMLRQHEGTEVANLLRSLGSPGELLRNVAAAASKMSTVSTLEPLSVGETQAVVRAQTRLGFPRHRHLCDFTHGLLAEIPVVFGLPPATVTESECQARGGRSCVYNVTWQRQEAPPFEFESLGPPAETEPLAAEPVAAEPLAAEPVAAQPVAAEPIVVEPMDVTEPVQAEAVDEPQIEAPAGADAGAATTTSVSDNAGWPERLAAAREGRPAPPGSPAAVPPSEQIEAAVAAEAGAAEAARREAERRAEAAQARAAEAEARLRVVEAQAADAEAAARREAEARAAEAAGRADALESRLRQAETDSAAAAERATSAEDARRRAADEAARASARADELAGRLAATEHELAQARQTADDAAGAAARARELADRLAATEQELAQARQTADDATRRVVDLEAEARQADARADDAVARLAGAEAQRQEAEGLATGEARRREEAERTAATAIARLSGWVQSLAPAAAAALVPDEVERVLARLVAAAAEAVGANRYLLVVQIEPGGRHHLLHRGYPDDEAQAAGRDLLDPVRRQEGDRLVVDVVSPSRHYGHLAVVLVPDGPSPTEATHVLGAYATLAAAALDLHGARSEARRAAATSDVVSTLAQALTEADDAGAVARALAGAATALGATSAAVAVADPASGVLELLAGPAETAAGEATDAAWLTDSITATPTALSAAAARLLAEDTVLVAGHHPDLGPSPLGQNSRSLAVGVVGNDEVLGVLWVAPGPGEPAPEPGTRHRYRAVAAVAGAALSRLRRTPAPATGLDPLSGLPDERILEDRVDRDLLRGTHTGDAVGLALLTVAPEGAGPSALQPEAVREVAQRLQQALRRYDTVARLDDGTFALALPDLPDPAAAGALAARAAAAVRRGVESAGPLEVTVRVAVGPTGGASFESLRQAAQAGAGPRGPEPVPEAHGGDLEHELSEAIAAGQLFVLYQPLVDLQTDAVVAVEALVRWQHPRRGVLKPEAFLPVAERSELIVAVDSWVLREAVRQVRAWATRRPLRVAVNVSPRSLGSDRYAEAVEAAVAGGDVRPEQLELEVPETVLANGTASGEVVRRLHALGVRFAVEDFGTGSTALRRLEEFPVSTLKIDRSFVGALLPDRQAATGATAIIRLAADLGADCVAEGVERSEQTRILLQRGCTTAQGYYFSPPLPAGEIDDLLAHGASIHVLEPPRG